MKQRKAGCLSFNVDKLTELIKKGVGGLVCPPTPLKKHTEMKHKLLLLLWLIVASTPLWSQRHDNIWMWGYDGFSVNPEFGGTVIDFSGDSLYSYKEDKPMNFYETMGVMSDTAGQLLFYTNGIYVANINHDTMQNGGGINEGYWADYFSADFDSGYRLRDGLIIVPDLIEPNHYRIFHLCITDEEFFPNQILTSLIDMQGDNALGVMVEKNKIIYQDNVHRLSQSHFNAVRHANGRDWWLVSIIQNTGELVLHLYTSDSIYRMQNQPPAYDFRSGIGQCQFSPDGAKFASGHVRFMGLDDHHPSFHYYTFDRCTGVFTPVFYEASDEFGVYVNSCVFSPNSRYLYQIYIRHIFRYDTNLGNVHSSKDTIAEWDGGQWVLPGGVNVNIFFGYGELGLDSNIYSTSGNTVPFIHQIAHPDDYALTEVIQHIPMPTANAWTVPNFPNYRLGPLEGSPCEGMLGPPTALYEYEAAALTVTFEDQSEGVPLTWYWDFGDGATSTEQHPQHTYISPGVYTACLTANNIFGGHTFCRAIEVNTSSILQPSHGAALTIRPNPASGQVDIQLQDAEGLVRLYDALGRLATVTALRSGVATFVLHGLPAGAYMVQVVLLDGHEVWEKLMIK
jgi:hypothetical protein